MAPVMIDAELVAKLTANGGKVPLVDRNGKLIGYFLSLNACEAGRQAVLAKVFTRVTDEQTRQALSDPQQYSLAELLDVMRGLGD